mgnify:CR=1 FL=1
MSSENTDLCHLITSTNYLKQRTAVLRSYVNGNAHVIVFIHTNRIIRTCDEGTLNGRNVKELN